MELNDLLNIQLILFDVDGVLTDGSLYISEQGESIKTFNVKDGLAIELLRCHGIKTGVVSGKSSTALDFRCNQLDFDFVITGCKNKFPKVLSICESLNIELSQVAFCGDDVLDLPVMNKCGLGVAVKDAHSLVLESADLVLNSSGGQGAARELADLILKPRFVNLSEVYQPLLDKISADDVDGIQQ